MLSLHFAHFRHDFFMEAWQTYPNPGPFRVFRAFRCYEDEGFLRHALKELLRLMPFSPPLTPADFDWLQEQTSIKKGLP